MKGACLLLAAAMLTAPGSASAQALVFGNSAATEIYVNNGAGYVPNRYQASPDTRFRFSALDPNDRFLPEEYQDRGSGYELRSALQTALGNTLDGIVEYRWNNGEDPTLAIAGVPAEMKFKKSTVMLGLNYRY